MSLSHMFSVLRPCCFVLVPRSPVHLEFSLDAFVLPLVCVVVFYGHMDSLPDGHVAAGRLPDVSVLEIQMLLAPRRYSNTPVDRFEA